jgi:hypothetical protein
VTGIAVLMGGYIVMGHEYGLSLSIKLEEDVSLCWEMRSISRGAIK